MRFKYQLHSIALAAALVTPSGRLLAQHDMTAMMAPSPVQTALRTPMSRIGSGTSWLPDSSTMQMASVTRGAWMLSVMGSAYVQYDQQLTKRGDTQLGVTDWEMLMAMRPLAGGDLQLRAMASIEPFVLGGSGYPQLLQSGGTYRHSPIHDRMHPHDGVMEFAAFYERPVIGAAALSLYAGAVGEPALGPVAFMHRPSAQNDPFAPIGHHWQDASHQSFGVVTLGVATRTLKLEGSAFNPREPDENHQIVDYRDAKLDSYAGRLSWAATPHMVASAWMAFLNSHERLDPTTRMHKWGASILTDADGIMGGRWSSALIYGVNVHDHGAGSHEVLHAAPGASPHHKSTSLLIESNLEIGIRSALFARFEAVEKSGDELGFSGGDLTTLYAERSVVIGGTRRLASRGPGELRLGARAALHLVPETLVATYGTRTPTGYALYLQLRPQPSALHH
jgi:hypothetical protein